MLRPFELIRVWIVLAASLATVALTSTPAAAQEMAGLRFETGQVDPNLADGLQSEVGKAFDSVDRWSFIDFDRARSKMDPVTRDCFTADCLTKAGQAIGAPAGLDVQMSGEAEIYDWTIQIWDLRSGDKLKTEEGTCELCGEAEVKRTFRSSLQAALIGTALPGGSQAGGSQAGGQAAAPQPGAGQIPLRISVIPADAEIYVDDQRAGQGEVTRAVGPGSHEVRFHKEGYQGLTEQVMVNEGTDGPVLLRVHLSRTDPEAVQVSSGVGPIDRMGSSRKVYGLIGVGAGAALLGTGIYLTAIDGNTACDAGVPDSECPDVYATAGAGMTMGVVGTALITGGVTLLTWESLAGETTEEEVPPSDQPADEAPPAGEADEAGVSLSPTVGAHGAGVLLHGRF